MDAKKLILVLGVVFLGFWLFTDPNGLANTASDTAGTGWGMLSDLFKAMINFVDAL